MKWGKFVLFFQAIVTLILGLLFFFQLLAAYQGNLDRYGHFKSISVVGNEGPLQISQSPNIEGLLNEFEFKFKTASYVLIVISLIEIVIISRLV